MVYRSESASEQDAQRRREGIYNFFQAALLLLLAEEEGRCGEASGAVARLLDSLGRAATRPRVAAYHNVRNQSARDMCVSCLEA
ncbi:hypothetical protein EMIHUDRAFT_247081 [Emiliania huxleyi CCMP1516]|uniref:Uncharacterized protein n=2 Tax=Emiliania huxleyi TaxID=2903 RepID=A0A0D3IPR4_EMIH1|nr:hypothetical protein EMIHUDRAFT_247081 [Emiliania huxleyi CCMP1516]EOD13249.1 hypothetical protein EMIHUDRAFT_247081 [Emiliania huxleyi CCMP1516]|eukprot:XP_005765678.1 hypothetical protein EMIHUDRAFT_247081 [Emiliania huxleyi CCMP1516]